MQLTGRQIIGGVSESLSSSTFSGVNPTTSEKLSPEFHEATPADIAKAAELASSAFETARAKPARERASLLREIANQILALGDDLILRANAETGLPRLRLEGERGRTCAQLKLFADVVEEGSWVAARIDRAVPDRTPLPRPDCRRMLVPLGPVAVFGASNFPLAFSVAGGDTASALAAGCSVVFKAHPAHPGTSEMVAHAITAALEKTGFPPGLFSLVQGASTQVGVALVRHPAIKAVGFTGSLKGGRALFDEAAKRAEPIPVYAEMGSTNPVFILPGALQERGEKIAEGLVASVTMGVGQFCTKPGVVFLPQGDGLATAFVDRSAALFAAGPAGVMLHGGIRSAFAQGAAAMGAVSGVRTLVAGQGEACNQKPSFFQASYNDYVASPALAEEVFGPATLAVTCSARDQVLAAAKSLHGHLTATLHGTEQDLKEWDDLVAILQTKVGRIIFNGWPTGVEVNHAMMHGGPYPATTDSRSTSVGSAAIYRWARPVCWQGFPNSALPEELRDENPRGIFRMIEGKLGKH